MKRMFFASFPRSGSIWYLTMLGESINANKSEMVYERTLKSHDIIHGQIKWFGQNDKVIYMYRHPKDALLSYARYEHRYREIVRWKTEGGKAVVGKLRGNVIKKRFNQEILKEILFTPVPRQSFSCVAWWIVMMEYYMSEELQSKVDVCYLKYEEVLVAPVKEIKKGLNFMEYNVEPLQVEKHLTSPHPKERLAIHTDKYQRDENWTEEIDDRVNKELGDNLEKYGYKR